MGAAENFLRNCEIKCVYALVCSRWAFLGVGARRTRELADGVRPGRGALVLVGCSESCSIESFEATQGAALRHKFFGVLNRSIPWSPCGH